MAVSNRQSDEDGVEGFSHRIGIEMRLRVGAIQIALVDDLAVLDDQQCIRIGISEDVLGRVLNTFELIREIELGFGLR